jgi:hypothetical protein
MRLSTGGFLAFMAAVLLIGAFAPAAPAASPVAHAAVTCSDYSNQADAQRNADTIDADGDGHLLRGPAVPMFE